MRIIATRRAGVTLAVMAAFATASPAQGSPVSIAADDGTPAAGDLLAATAECNQVSHGTYRNPGAGARVPVCARDSVYFWTSGMAVDCDGQRSDRCSPDTDPDYQSDTAVHQSDGQPLNAASTPYVVIPQHSDIWNYTTANIDPGDVAAVVYNGHVEYAVFGDVGPAGQIGEASRATAAALGINPDPRRGGVGNNVTYIVFPGTRPSTVESHDQAVDKGRAAASAFVRSH